MTAGFVLAASRMLVLAATVQLSLAPRVAAAEIVHPGESVDGTLESDRDRAFEAPLEAGQLAQVEVVQVGLDVVLEVTAPTGEVLAKVDHARVREALETFTWVVSTTGPHRIALRTRRARPEGRFRLRLEVRPTGPTDRLLVEAERAFGEGVREREGRGSGFRTRAEAAFDKAADLWRQAGAARGQVRALIAAGAVGWTLDSAQAGAKCMAALGLAQDISDAGLETDALNCLAESFYALGAYDEAIESQQNAMEAAVASGNRFRESEALQNLGVFHNARLETNLASTRYEEAVAVARAIGDEEALGLALAALGATATNAGEYQRAQDLLEEALEVHRATGDLAAQSNTFLNLALNRQELGNHEEALDAAMETLRLSRLSGTPANEVYAFVNMSRIAIALGDSKAGIARAREALEVARRLNAPREERTALDSLAFAHFKAGAYPAALQAIEGSIAVSRRMGLPPVAQTMLNSCRLLEAEGNLSAAADRCVAALDAIRSVGPQRLEALASYLLARLEHRQGHLDGARRRAEQALGLLEKSRSGLRRTDWRESFIGSQREIDDFYVDLMIETAARGGQERAAEAFDAAERTRTRALRDALTESRLGGRDGIDARLVERERQLRHQLARGIEAQLRRGPSHPSSEAASARLPQLEEELKRVESEIRRLGPRYAGLNESTPLSLSQLQESFLDADTALLAFALGESRSAMWVVTRETLEMHLLPGRRRLDTLARAAYGSWSGRRAPASGTGRELARLIVRPALQRLRPRLLVIADGTLHYLPFAALPDPRGGVLLDRHDVVVLPSASTVRLLRRPVEPNPARPARRAVAVLADPVFRPDDERIPRSLGGAAPPDRVPGDVTRAARDVGGLEELTRLPFTRREAMRIAGLTGPGESVVALDFDANLRTAREGKLGEYQFVHFATHGFLNPRRPELSGLVLSLFDAQGRPQEGFLTSLDAFNLDLSAEVVVLSGCRTALGKEVRGEGLVGLPQAFMYAGARRVVSSLWAVDDLATAALMGRFYEGLLAPRPLSPAAALRAAQSHVRSRPQWRHPYYWAAFQLQGDWN